MVLENLVLDRNDLSNNHFVIHSAPQTIGKLSTAVKNCLKLNRLNTLSLNECNLTKTMVKAICEGLKQNKTLQHLNLRDNSLKI